jgi:hypothetical protein
MSTTEEVVEDGVEEVIDFQRKLEGQSRAILAKNTRKCGFMRAYTRSLKMPNF